GVGRANEQHGETRVEYVARRHSAVKPAGVRTGQLFHVGQEGNDVVPRRPFDLVDAVGVENELLVADLRGGSLGHETLVLHGITSGELDLEPDLVARGARPEIAKVLGGIAGDHEPGTVLARPLTARDRTEAPFAT